MSQEELDAIADRVLAYDPDVANAEGATTQRQKGMVYRAIILQGGFSHIGIVALADETTGYQHIREERALA